jgi:hypothetical protein
MLHLCRSTSLITRMDIIKTSKVIESTTAPKFPSQTSSPSFHNKEAEHQRRQERVLQTLSCYCNDIIEIVYFLKFV